MTIINLQRDAVFQAPEKTTVTFGTAAAFNHAQALLANTDPVVQDAYGSVHTDPAVDIILASATQARTMGMFMRPPGSELTPYRVKCYAGVTDPAVSFRMAIGFGEGTIDGANDNITHWESFAFDKKLDELFLVEPQVTTGISPIFFGILFVGIITTGAIDAHISVQRLATSPPQFSQSVS